MTRPTGRPDKAAYQAVVDLGEKKQVGNLPTLSTGAVFKYVVDLTGPTTELPIRLDPRSGFVIQVADKRTFKTVVIGWDIQGRTIQWGISSDEYDKYRAVIMW